MLKFINTQGLVYTPLIWHNDIHVFNMVNVTVQHNTWSIIEFIELRCVTNTPTKPSHCFVNDFVYAALSSTRSCTLSIRCSISNFWHTKRRELFSTWKFSGPYLICLPFSCSHFIHSFQCWSLHGINNFVLIL